MNYDMETAVAHALAVARACWGLAGDAIHEGEFPRELAMTIASSAAASAAEIQDALERTKGRLAADLQRVLYHAAIDLQTIGGLAGLVTTFNLAPRNARHVAQALIYTAEKATEALANAEHRLHAM